MPVGAGDTGPVPGSGGSLEEGELQYSCLEDPMDGGSQCSVHRVAEGSDPA